MCTLSKLRQNDALGSFQLTVKIQPRCDWKCIIFIMVFLENTDRSLLKKVGKTPF